MRVLLAGATGALGRPLTAALVAGGHEVLALSRSAARAPAPGVRPVVADALDRDALLRAADGLSADAVIHELTALRRPPYRHSGMAATDRLRTEGTANLLAAADALGANRFLTQSIVLGYGIRDHGDRPLTEEDPFGEPRGDRFDPHLAAMRATERQAFTAPEGIALRYGALYGGDLAAVAPLLRRRRLPVVSSGLLAWVHHEDAADATVAALERGLPGRAYNVVDDRAATWREVFTALAAAVGAPPPRSVPVWLLRLLAPYLAACVVDTSMRVSNARARAELGWSPRYPTVTEGAAAAGAALREEAREPTHRAGRTP
ncbi:NAD-dependent epimerase/dehydratase family protein [Geodermatophilus sp. SYSU D00703]